MTQKPNESLVRKLPLPLDIEVGEGTIISDGWMTLTSKELSHIRLISVDADGFLRYEVTLPRKSLTEPLSDYIGEDQLIGRETTMVTVHGQIAGQYRYFKRADCSYYAVISGTTGQKPHKVEVGKLIDRESPISTVARAIAYKFDTKKFSRNDLKPLIPKYLTYAQKLKSLLDILHYDGFLKKEIDPTSKNKAKELFTATENLKKIIIPSPNPEQT